MQWHGVQLVTIYKFLLRVDKGMYTLWKKMESEVLQQIKKGEWCQKYISLIRGTTGEYSKWEITVIVIGKQAPKYER